MKLLWLDLESTGLDPREDCILEIAAIIAELEQPFVAGRRYSVVLGCSVAERALHPTVVEMHTKSGLFEECRNSRIALADAEQALLSLVPEVSDPEELTMVAGSSAHFDRGFLRAHMLMLSKRLSHRIYDVSAVKMFCRSLGMPKLETAKAHRAVDDLQESIAHAIACEEWLRSYGSRAR